MGETEKVTVNMGVVDLGQIDLLVQQGFYSNRTDFIRTACRNVLAKHEDEVRQTVNRRRFSIGIEGYGREELEEAVANGERLEIKVVGMAIIHKSVPVDLVLRAIKSIEVYGVFRATQEVKDALGVRIQANVSTKAGKE